MVLHLNNKPFSVVQTMWLVASLFALVLIVLQPVKVQAENDNWSQWAQHNEASMVEIDHSTWNRLLQTYVTTNSYGQNLFNYAAVSPADRRALKHYLELLSNTPVKEYNKNEQLAFWINLYNAIIVQAVLNSYPVDSILNVEGDIFSRGPWKNHYLTIGGFEINLSNIRNDIIFANWEDVRIIYALSCGAIGCPNIGSKAFRGKHIGGQLDGAATAFINGPQAILEFNGSSVVVSKLFYWAKGEFKRENIRLLAHIKSYAVGSISRKLQNVDHVEGYSFNWGLNKPVNK